MKGKDAQKNFGALGAMAPKPLSLKIPRGGGGLGVSHTMTGPGRAPPPPPWWQMRVYDCEQKGHEEIVQNKIQSKKIVSDMS